MFKLFRRKRIRTPQNKVEEISYKIDSYFSKAIKVIAIGATLFALVQVIPAAIQYFYIKQMVASAQEKLETLAIPAETQEAKVIQITSDSKMLVNASGKKLEIEVAPIGEFTPQLQTKFLPGQIIHFSYEQNSKQVRIWKVADPKSYNDLL